MSAGEDARHASMIPTPTLTPTHHRHQVKISEDKKNITTKWSAGSGRARSWSGRLKLSFRVVGDSAKIEALLKLPKIRSPMRKVLHPSHPTIYPLPLHSLPLSLSPSLPLTHTHTHTLSLSLSSSRKDPSLERSHTQHAGRAITCIHAERAYSAD